MDFPHELVQAIAEGSAVLFIGAGLSQGAGLPGWAGLLAPLADEIGLPAERRGDLLQVAQWCEDELGRRALLDRVRRATETADVEPTEVHQRLARLGLDTWITTNYDDLLERALAQAGQRVVKVVRDQDLPYTHPGAVTLLKLHGDRDQPETIVLTRHDYETFFRRYELLRTKLRALLAEKTFLFLGYGINDPDFNQVRAEIGDALREHDRRAYAVLFEGDEWALKTLKGRNIEPLTLEAAGPHEYNARLGEWLDGLIEQVGREPGAQLKPLLQTRVATGAAALHQLPPPPADFVGRERELAELEAAFAEDGSVGAGVLPPPEAQTPSPGAAITGLRGMGGVGKTALALVLAERLTPRYPDAQIYLDLRGASRTPLSAAEAMAHVIRSYLPTAQLPEDPAQLAALYRSTLHGQRALLLMDNAAGRAQVEPLLCPASCALLVTSRQHFVLPGLKAVNLDALPEEDAVALLVKIAARLATPQRPPLRHKNGVPPRQNHGGEEERSLDTRQPRAGAPIRPPPRGSDRLRSAYGGDRGGASEGSAAELARLCGYLPLALRLAGSALAEREDMPVGEYLARLREAPGRQALVEPALRASYELLGEGLRARWRALAVFPATFDRAAAAAVWAAEEGAAQEALSELHRYSMVEWDGDAARYRLHDLARDCAGAWLEGEERGEAERRHAAHYERVLRAARTLYEQGGDGVLSGLALFDLERGNVEAGQRWAAGHAGEDKAAARLCCDYPMAGTHIRLLRLGARDRIQWLKAAVQAASRLEDKSFEGMHLGSLGLAYRHLGEVRKAIEYYKRALVIAQEIGDRGNEGVWLESLGLAYRHLGETEKAIEHTERALAIAQEIGDRRGEGSRLGSLGLAYRALGETRTAIEYYERALAISQEIGDRRNESVWLGNLGLAYRALGEARAAIEYCERALAISQEIGDRRGEGIVLGNLGFSYFRLEETEKAAEHYQQALAIAQETGSRSWEAEWSWYLGLLYEKTDPARAVELMSVRVAYEREIGHPDAEAHAERVERIRRGSTADGEMDDGEGADNG